MDTDLVTKTFKSKSTQIKKGSSEVHKTLYVMDVM